MTMVPIWIFGMQMVRSKEIRNQHEWQLHYENNGSSIGLY